MKRNGRGLLWRAYKKGLRDFAVSEQIRIGQHIDHSSGLIVDTASVSDAEQVWETAVCHPAYNLGNWVAVEMYETRTQAEAGHTKWVQIMTAEQLPERLFEVSTALIIRIDERFGANYSQGFSRTIAPCP